MDELIRRRFRVHGETGLLMHQRKPFRRHIYNNIEQPQRENNVFSTDFNNNPIAETKHRPIIFNKLVNEANFNKIHPQIVSDEVNNNDEEDDEDQPYDDNKSNNIINGEDDFQKSERIRQRLHVESLKTNQIVRATNKRSSPSNLHMSTNPTILRRPNAATDDEQSNSIETRLTFLEEPEEMLSTNRLISDGQQSRKNSHLHQTTKSIDPASLNNHDKFIVGDQQQQQRLATTSKNLSESRNKLTISLPPPPRPPPTTTNNRETILARTNFPPAPNEPKIPSSDRQDNQQQLENVGTIFNANNSAAKFSHHIEENRSDQLLVSESSNTPGATYQQQHLVFLASSSILFLLIILIFYGWFFKRRTIIPKSCTKPLFNNSSSAALHHHHQQQQQRTTFSSIFTRPLFSSTLGTLSKRISKSSNYSHCQQHKRESCGDAEVIDGLIEGCAGVEKKNSAVIACEHSEHMQLLERKNTLPGGVIGKSYSGDNNCAMRKNNSSTGATYAEVAAVDDDTIQVVESYTMEKSAEGAVVKNGHSTKNSFQENQTHHGGVVSESLFANKMVILRRKLGKSSLVVTAKRSTKPRVKLITGRVRKFIDDEANDIQQKRECSHLNSQKEKEPWRLKALAYIFTALRSNNFDTRSNDAENSLAQENKQQATAISINTCDQNQRIDDIQSDHSESYKQIQSAASNSSSSISNDEYVSALNNTNSLAAVGASSASFNAEIHPTPLGVQLSNQGEDTTNNLTSDKQTIPTGIEDKLSPSNLNLFNIDGCSSISGCSLFLSPSPIDATTSSEHHQHHPAPLEVGMMDNPTCGCSYNHNNRYKNTPLPDTIMGINQPVPSNNYNIDYFRTRSQGVAGCTGFVGVDTNPALSCGRPCCSVSPTAINQQLYQSNPIHQPRVLQAANPNAGLSCCNSASPTYHQHHHPINPATESHTKTTLPFNPVGGFANSNNIKSSSLTNTNKFCSIKRQYENYYDDEQEEAYRRLTASIGMEFGLGFHHHHHHSPSSLTANQELMHFAANNINRYTCLDQTSSMINHQNHNHHQQLGNNQNQSCKCCQKAQPTTQSAYETSACFQNQFGQTHHKYQPMGEYQNPYLFKNGTGSVGELVSTASTSLAGCDSGFVSSTLNNGNIYGANTCPNQQCSCRYNNQIQQSQRVEVPMPPPPMSILVQQPSLVTPPPPLSGTISQQSTNELNSEGLGQKAVVKVEKEEGRGGSSDLSDQTGTPSGRSQEVSPQHSPNTASSFVGGAKLKWKHHARRFSQRSPATNELILNNIYGAEQGASWRPTRSATRRMSIAGDQVSNTVFSQQNSGPLQQGLNHGIAPNHVYLQHRASIGTADICGTANHHHQKQYQQHTVGNGSICSQNQGQRPSQINQQQQINSHRPSDASLYEGQYYSGITKSCYSSSSSSGIGINGSTCATNTPTSVHPNSGFALGTRPLDLAASEHPFAGHVTEAELMLRARSQHHQASPQHHHESFCQRQAPIGSSNNELPYLHSLQTSGTVDPLTMNGVTMNPGCLCLQPVCQSRKYSLPVHLESQAAERLHSPNMDETQLVGGRLLFEKNNLNRMDSTNSQSIFTQTSLTTGTTSSGIGSSQHQQRLPGDTVQVPASQQQRRISSITSSNLEHRNGRLNESRRSSQTITRQSSFWLDDNSLDSMMMSSFASGVKGQQSENGSQLDVNPLPVDSIPEQQQHPSFSSLILSGDSIESVKQKPIINNEGDQKTECDTQNEEIAADQSTSEMDDVELEELKKRLHRNAHDPSSKRFNPFSPLSSGSSNRRSFRSLARMRNRLPSSSTSSNTTASSPSPDFTRPSERILAIASKSSATISKRSSTSKNTRHQYSKKFPRLGSSNQKSNNDGVADSKKYKKDESEDESSSTDTLPNKHLCGPSSTTATASEGDLEKQNSKETSGSQQSCDTEVDGEFLNVNNGRVSDGNSSSLERQCKELWKLRAALQDDSCVGDNWSNYHQRLNRRYDSGYKSIENQLSSSLEGNTFANASGSTSNSNVINQPTVGVSPTDSTSQHLQLHLKRQQSLNSSNIAPTVSERPRSGCSGMMRPNVSTRSPFQEAEQKECDSSSSREEEVKSDLSAVGIEYKLTELGLDEVALDCMIFNDEPGEVRECISRSSKASSEEETSRQKTPTLRTPNLS